LVIITVDKNPKIQVDNKFLEVLSIKIKNYFYNLVKLNFVLLFFHNNL
jgi:hypothetical protein